MDKEDFRRRLRRATAAVVELSRGFIRESLPDTALYRIALNSSYDGDLLDADFVVYPTDSELATSAELVDCSESQFVDALWRDGRIPR